MVKSSYFFVITVVLWFLSFILCVSFITVNGVEWLWSTPGSDSWCGLEGAQCSIAFRPIILILLTNKDVALIIYSVTIVHFWCIKILTWLRGFRVKNANFSWLHCLAIPRRDLSTKKNKSNDHRKMTRKPWSHARILIYQTWAFVMQTIRKLPT